MDVFDAFDVYFHWISFLCDMGARRAKRGGYRKKSVSWASDFFDYDKHLR